MGSPLVQPSHSVAAVFCLCAGHAERADSFLHDLLFLRGLTKFQVVLVRIPVRSVGGGTADRHNIISRLEFSVELP